MAVIEHQGLTARAGELRRNPDAKILQEAEHIATPAGSNRRGTEGVLQDQIPSDNPGEDLSQGGVSVGIRGAANRNQGGELCIAESREGAPGTGQHEGKHDCGSGILSGGGARQHEDAGSDNGADSQRHQVHRPEHSSQAGFALLFCLQQNRIQRLRCQQIGHLCCS